MGRKRSPRRVLVATDQPSCPMSALEHAAAAAGEGGEVVLASVIVVPVTQPLDANLERSVTRACEVLEDAEAAARERGGAFDTRLVRARSFAKGVLQTLEAEPFDLLVLERSREQLRNGAGAQTQALLEKAPTTTVLVRPRETQG
jgi:nucleotide-binding universal stress UspA family protein